MKLIKGNIPWLLFAVCGFVVLVGRAVMFYNLGDATFNFNDFPILTYTAEAARRFHAESGLLWGYEPHFMAGYPLGFIWNSNVSIQWFAVRFADAPALQVVRAFFLAGLFLFPLIWWWTLRNFGMTRREASGSFLLGSLYFLLGMPILFFLSGMLTAGAVTYISLFSASFIYRYGRDGGLWWIGAAVSAAFVLFIHKTAVVILFIPVCLVAVMIIRRRGYARLAGLAAAGVVVLAVNWFWIRPTLLMMRHIKSLPEAPFWQNRDLLRPFKDYFTGGVVMNNLELTGAYGVLHGVALWLLLITGIAGIFKWLRGGEHDRAAFFAVTAGGLWVYSYYGAFLPGGDTLNPTRYFPVAQMWLAAAGGAMFSGGFSGKRDRGGKLPAFAVATQAVVSIVCIAGMVYASNRLKPFEALLTWPMPPQVTALVERIEALPRGGRIMIEDSGVMNMESGGRVYGESQILSHFGLWTGREFVGGPYPYVFEDYHYVSFQDGRAFGRSLSDFNPKELLERLKLYNVKWIICWSSGCREYFNAYGGYYRFADRSDRFDIFEVSGYEPTYFLKGGGRVTADYGKLSVYGARANDGSVVLKYHWMAGCRSEPALKVAPYRVPGDPVGFIQVLDPPEKFVILMP